MFRNREVKTTQAIWTTEMLEHIPFVIKAVAIVTAIVAIYMLFISGVLEVKSAPASTVIRLFSGCLCGGLHDVNRGSDDGNSGKCT